MEIHNPHVINFRDARAARNRLNVASEGRHQSPLLVTIEQAASILGIGRTHLYGLISDGEIATVSIGRCRRIAMAELERYVDSLSISEDL